MADPFSVVASSVGLLDVLVRCGNCIKELIDSAGRIEEEIRCLSNDLDALNSIRRSLEKLFNAEHGRAPDTPVADIWGHVGTLLKGCKATVEDVEGLVKEMIGKGGSAKPTGKLDGLKKAFRKAGRDEDIKDLRLKLTDYQSSLQVCLGALNLEYTRISQDSTDQSFSHLSQDVHQMELNLIAQINSLRPKLVSPGGDHFLNTISSVTTIASSQSINKHFNIPQTVSSIFTGRESLLAELGGFFELFGDPTNFTGVQKRFIIYGLGGSGKTQFCCKFAQQNRRSFWGVFCIDAASPETAEHSFSKIVKAAKIEPSEGSNQLAAKDWLSSLEHTWLLLIDNADDPSLCLENYFPDGERGCILASTRDPEKKIHGTVGSLYYHFERLETSEANDLLLKAACYPRPYGLSTIKSADIIANTLGFLPLALVQAGKAIVNGLCSLTNYIEHYQQNWERIRQARRSAGYRGNESENLNVYSSYDINLRSLEESNKEIDIYALELLKMFSCLNSENIHIDFLIAAAKNPRLEREQEEKDKQEEARMKKFSRPNTWSEYFRDRFFRALEFILKDRGPPFLPSLLRETAQLSPFDEKLLNVRLRHTLGILSRMSLITHHEDSDVYSMHPLVHTWVRERPEMTIAEQALWCQVAITTLSKSIRLPPHGSLENEEEMRRNLLPHIIHVRKCKELIDKRISDNQEKLKLTWKPVLQGGFGRRQALESAKFSRVYLECGLWKEAEQLQLATKNFVCKRLGTEHPAAIAIMLFLSATYWNQTRVNEAAELQDQVYQACVKSYGPNSPKTLKVMDTLGSSRCYQGRFKESLELHSNAIKGMRETDQVDKEDYYVALCNLGRINWRYFRFEEAKNLHLQALEGLKRVLGPTHLQTLVAMEDLAMSYMDCGQEFLEPAHALMLEVLNQRRAKLGKEQPFTLLAICNLARVKCALGQTIEAENLFRGAIPIAEKSLGENHIGTLGGKTHFAQVLVKQKRYAEAEEIFTKVIEKERYATAARNDGEYPDRIFALWCLVQCYELHGKVDEALVGLAELRSAVDSIGGQGFGKLHPISERIREKRDELETLKKNAANQPSQSETLLPASSSSSERGSFSPKSSTW